MAFTLPTAPDFLDQKYFEKIIKHIEKDANATISSFEIAPGSNPGQNFGSALFRAKVTFKSKYTKDDKTISLIVKTLPNLPPGMEAWAESIQKAPFFRNEMEVYGKILPDIQSLLLSAGDKEVLSPKMLFSSNDPKPVIVFEDVSVDGYTGMKLPSEDYEVSKKIVERLAKFHAGTFYLISEHKLDPSEFNYTIFEDPATAQMLLGSGIEGLTDAMKEWDGCEKYVKQFEAYRETYLSQILKSYAPNQTEFGYNVLNHADFHINNLLFKTNDEGKIENFYFIDYQICKYATPAIDLIYALYYHLSVENRHKYRAEFINSYYTQFVASLKQFGYIKAPPSLLDLQIELLKHGHLEVLLAVCHSALFYVDISKMTPEDMDQGEGTKRFRKRLYNTPEYKEMVLKELPRFLYNGFI